MSLHMEESSGEGRDGLTPALGRGTVSDLADRELKNVPVSWAYCRAQGLRSAWQTAWRSDTLLERSARLC